MHNHSGLGWELFWLVSELTFSVTKRELDRLVIMIFMIIVKMTLMMTTITVIMRMSLMDPFLNQSQRL